MCSPPLTGLCGRLCSLKPLNSAKDRKKLTLLYLSMLCLMQSGDTELNPGPEFPCKIWNLECDWSKYAVQCEKCEIWNQADCMYMNSHVYRALEDSDVSWICCQCGMPSFSSSLFSSCSTVLSNSFSTLASLSERDEPSSPMAQSFPVMRPQTLDSNRTHTGKTRVIEPITTVT